MSTFVNVRPGRWRGTDQPVSALVSTKWADRAGYPACFTQRFTHDRHAVGVCDHAEVRSQVRAAGTHPGADTGPVRTGGSHLGSQPPMHEPSVRTWAACLLRNVEVTRRWFPLWFPRYCRLAGGHHSAVNDHMKTTNLTGQHQPMMVRMPSCASANKI